MRHWELMKASTDHGLKLRILDCCCRHSCSLPPLSYQSHDLLASRLARAAVPLLLKLVLCDEHVGLATVLQYSA